LSEDGLEEKALALIKTRPNGVLQSDLWKDLDIDSRKCSRVIAKLEADGKIKRTWETVKGTRTYRISYMPQKKEAPKKEVDFSMIMAAGKVAPCIGCTYECEPDYCPDLGNWIELLAREPVRPVKPILIPEVIAEPEKEMAAERPAPVKAKKGKAPVEIEEIKEKPVPPKAKKAKEPVKAPAKVAPKVPVKAPVKAVKPAKAVKPSKEVKPVKEAKKPLKAPARKVPISSKKAAKEPPAKPAARVKAEPKVKPKVTSKVILKTAAKVKSTKKK